MIKALNDHADEFIKSLEFLPTFPFHYDYLRKAVRGDYLNVFVTFDLTLRRLGETVFTTSKGLDPNMKRMSEVINTPDFLIGANSNLSGQAADPEMLRDPSRRPPRGDAWLQPSLQGRRSVGRRRCVWEGWRQP